MTISPMRPKKIPASTLKHPAALLACGFGTGLAPFAPGTFGTLVGLPIYGFMQYLTWPVYITLTILLFIFGVWICEITSKKLQVHDHPGIVWDEVVGYLVTMTLAPVGWFWWLCGFGLFRLFDIWKPWPIRLLDKHVKGGFGIMVDDVLAGVYAAACLQLIYYGYISVQ